MPFKRNPNFENEAARDPKMRDYLKTVADDVAQEIDTRLPYRRIMGKTLKVTSRVNTTTKGFEGEARVEGAGWHFWEFGTINHGAKPAIRPGATAALARRDGQLGDRR